MKKYNTKKRKQMRLTKLLFATFVLMNFTAIALAKHEFNVDFQLNQREMQNTTYQADKTLVGANNAELRGTGAVIREVTMYNSLPEQTDNTPCISADGTNICEVDYNICATNAFPFGTRLHIDKLGECIVKDRMNSRYKERIDWYAKMDLERALVFGKQNLMVSVIR